MEDDIDDLLNEVESKYCAAGRQKCSKNDKCSSDSLRPSASNERTSKTTPTASDANNRSLSERSKKSGGDAALNAMIDDIFDDSDLMSSEPPQTADSCSNVVKSGNSQSSCTSSHRSKTSKCFPIYIGGSHCSKGISTAVNKRTCDMLRCTDCDFNVEMFDDANWRPETDYLFLRNNMPDYDKLRVNLVTRKGFRAYACQCMWKSIQELSNLQEFPNLKWVCGKH